MAIDPKTLLAGLPASLRTELLGAYTEIERNYREHRWEPSELNAGKLCEVVYSILDGYVKGGFPSAASKPANMVDACRLLEKATAFPRSVRVQIPRMLIALYEVRNNRGVGHVGGDVDPNEMDATCVLQMSKWVVAELIRIFHGVPTSEAEAAVNALSERELFLVWKVGGKLRVLDTTLSMADQTLVLLYSTPKGMSEAEVLAAVEHSNSSVYRRDILRKLHGKRFVEYSKDTTFVQISPLGSSYVETTILSKSG